jgi:AcrR family transcriptional regulator
MSEKKEARRLEILAYAMQAFAAKGYDKTTMDDIVRVSGLSKGTIYWHFKNKQALYLAMIGMITDQTITLFDEVLRVSEADDLNPPDALRRMFSSTADVLEANPIFSAMTVDFFLQAFHDEEIKTQFSKYYVEFINRTQKIIQKGIEQGFFVTGNVHHAAIVVAGALDGLSALSLLKKELHDLGGMDIDLRAILDTAAEMMITGLTKEKKDA